MLSQRSLKFFREHKIVCNIITKRKQTCYLHIGRMWDLVKKQHTSTNYVYCNECFIQLKVKRFSCSTGITILNNHLRKHNIISIKTKKRKEAAAQVFRGQVIPKHEVTKMKMSHMLIRWFATDSLPFKTVENTGFCNFLLQNRIVDNTELIPTRVYLSENALNDFYDFTKKNLILRVKSINFFCVQIDIWSDNYSRNPYIGIILNFVDENDWMKKKIALKTSGFPHPHTGELIGLQIEEVLNEFEIPKEKVMAVTDNGSNILKALTDINIKRRACVGHNIHLLLKVDGIENVDKVENILKKLNKIHRKIVFQKSKLLELEEGRKQVEIINKIIELENEGTLDNEEIFHVGNKTGYRQLHLASPTRWSGTYKLCNSFLNLKDSLHDLLRILNKERLILSNEDIKLVTEIKTILGFFMEPLTYLQGQSYPTLNKSAKYIVETKAELVEFQPETAGGIDLRNRIINSYSKRLRLTDDMITAALMDPFEKDQPFIIGYLRKKRTIKSIFLKDQYRMLKIDELIEPSCDQRVSVNKIEEKNLFQIYEQTEIEEQNQAKTLDQEINCYLSNIISENIDVLAWWKSNQKTYKKLSLLAQNFLGVSAMSSDVEATFSTMGYIVTARRSALDTKKLLVIGLK